MWPVGSGRSWTRRAGALAMLELVLSGGQTGVDQAALRAAHAVGLATGGAMPRGFLTEDGPRPDLAEMFGVVELASADYPTRTRRNVDDADAVLWLGDWHSPGARTTLDHCRLTRKPFFIIMPMTTRPSEVVAWLRTGGYRVLNVAGSRESRAPGIGARAERFLTTVFRQLIGPRQ